MIYTFEKMICTVLLSCLFSFIIVSSNDIKEEVDRGAHSDRGGLWFGPRLGKRSLKLSDEDHREAYFRLLEAADTLKFYYDQLPYLERRNEPQTRVTKKVIFTPKLGRSLSDSLEKPLYEHIEFTPRLGRRVADDIPVTPADVEVYQPGPDRVSTRNRYFSPRLGRTINFSPRLGRELNYDTYPENIRVARSINVTKSKKN